LIVAEPGQVEGRRIGTPVSLVDLLPTFMDFAAGQGKWQPTTPLDGRSLVPLLRDGKDGGRNGVISEYTGEGGCAPCRMVRSGNYKLIYTHGHPDLLYDLGSDPDELNNLADDPKYATVRGSLRQKIFEDWGPAAIHQRILQSQRERRLIHNTTKGEPNWAFKVRSDDDRRYVRNSGAVQVKAKARYPFFAPPPIRS
jgi:choline-sulfatase